MLTRLIENMYGTYHYLTARWVAYVIIGGIAFVFLLWPSLLGMVLVLFVLFGPPLYAFWCHRQGTRLLAATLIAGGWVTTVGSMLFIALVLPELTTQSSIVIGGQMMALGLVVAVMLLRDELWPIIRL
jgi:hypothetical protein